jgi:hypothetical protein
VRDGGIDEPRASPSSVARPRASSFSYRIVPRLFELSARDVSRKEMGECPYGTAYTTPALVRGSRVSHFPVEKGPSSLGRGSPEPTACPSPRKLRRSEKSLSLSNPSVLGIASWDRRALSCTRGKISEPRRA